MCVIPFGSGMVSKRTMETKQDSLKKNDLEKNKEHDPLLVPKTPPTPTPVRTKSTEPSTLGPHTEDLKDDELADTQLSVDVRDISNESVWVFILQSLFPLLISGAGLIGSGLLLDKWQNAAFYTRIHEAFILTPALLGLKGNLEMTFASRLATLAHQGKLDAKNNSKWKILGGNMALIQAQATVVSFFAAALTVITTTIRCEFHLFDSMVMTSSAISATSISSVLLGLMMIALVLASRKCRINPDNVMAPIAASFGDFITFLFFIGAGTALIAICPDNFCIPACVLLVLYTCLLPVWIWISYKNEYTRATLKWGWIAIGIAACISSVGGFILERAVIKFQNLALFQPLLCGLAGNRVAVQCSRLSTCFHTSNEAPGEVTEKDTFGRRFNPWYTFNCQDVHSRTAMVLIGMALPSHLLFISVIIAINGDVGFHWQFMLSYLVAASIQIIFLMYVCQLLVYALWRIKADPDHGAIPIMTSLSDLLGTGLLFAVFALLENTSPESIGDHEDLSQILDKTGVCL